MADCNSDANNLERMDAFVQFFFNHITEQPNLQFVSKQEKSIIINIEKLNTNNNMDEICHMYLEASLDSKCSADNAPRA